MPYDLTNPLVIGISSRALFDLEEENRIFEEQGLDAYEEYQVCHEKDILRKGAAFALAEAFLGLNKLQDERLVEVIVMSRNSPNTSLRIFNSIEHYGLDITRAALSGGGAIAPYLHAFQTDLFLSAHQPDVQQAINSGVAAGTILTGTVPKLASSGQIRIAFDGDAVLFSPASERIFQHKGLEAFDGVVLLASHDHEMLESTCNRVIAFQPDGTIIDRYGTYDDYLEWQAQQKEG